MDRKTRVLFLTTSRSDYGPCSLLLTELQGDARFELSLVVAGAHLDERHGATAREIEGDGLSVHARVPFSDLGGAAAGFSAVVADARAAGCDVAVVYGDRWEILPFAVAAALAGLPLAHICGGDVTEGAVDDGVRHAITKLAHVHLPATAAAAARIAQLGEERFRIHPCGDPAIDVVSRAETAREDELREALGFVPDHETLLVALHPVTASPGETARAVHAVAAAIARWRGTVVVTGPAPDAGHEAVRDALRGATAARAGAVYVESLGSRRYRAVLRRAGVLLGNSSSGVIEAGAVPVPVVNVGTRQRGRERGPHVIDAEPTEPAVWAALARAAALSGRLSSSDNPWGDGQASLRIRDVLASLPSYTTLLSKRFIDDAARGAAVCITVRMSSTRLPGKAMAEILGRPAIAHVINRARRARSTSAVIVATTRQTTDDQIADAAAAEGALVFRGDDDDLLVRMRDAAMAFGIRKLVTVDGDDLFVDDDTIDRVAAELDAADFVEVEGMPDGSYPHGVRVDALERVCDMKDERDTQGWGRYFTETRAFRTRSLPAADGHRRTDLRLTLDYPEDLALVRAVYEAVGPAASLGDVIAFLDAHPSVKALNDARRAEYQARFADLYSHVRLKTQPKDEEQ